jgi:hypothetical protein
MDPKPTPNRSESSHGRDLMVRRERTIPRPFHTRWSDHRAWISSCILHTCLFVSVAILWRPIAKGTNGEKDRPIGIAVVHQTSNGTEYFIAGGSTGATASGNTASENAATVPVATPGATSVEQILSELMPATSTNVGTGAESIGSGLAGGGTSGLSGADKGEGKTLNQTKTSFLGLEGVGASFVYVLDRSDSMNTQSGAPMYLAKRELMQSIESLGENHQFQIVFYNDSPSPLSSSRGGNNRLLFAKPIEKSRATQFIRGMVANGSTEHARALKKGLDYAPDVLFFMTDGDLPGLSSNQLAEVQEAATRSGTTIHTIQFRGGPQEGDGGWIRSLAEMNRGKYRYVNVEEMRAAE